MLSARLAPKGAGAVATPRPGSPQGGGGRAVPAEGRGEPPGTAKFRARHLCRKAAPARR